ncbi:MAG: N-methyl-L-tryptophan oxidase [Planctomycetes bacterium]|nr:N-methyl-L-tryptophan oxidase [Planctomycetota bacterium]
MFDVIVVGLGGVGSATCYALAKKGLKVLGIDQHQPPHGFGSSHGDTRIIRKSYFEHPSYVPLLKSAYSLWQEIESRSQTQLYYPTGLLEIGPGDGDVIQGILRSAAEHHLPIDKWSMQKAQERYPGIGGDPNWQAVFERDAGYLLVEKCIATYLSQAEQLGATLRYHQKMISWAGESHGVQVRLQHETIHAKKLVLCAGPWAQQSLAKYDLPLKVLRKHMYWYQCDTQDYLQSHGFPCFFFDTPDGYFYGFPEHGTYGLKVARHSGGTPVEQVDGTHNRDQEDQQLVEKFLSQYLPNVLGPQANPSALTRWSGCYYTMTPDENFIVDRLPDYPQVVVIAGLSGHGFKFTSVLGEIASHLAMETDCGLDIDFLGINRYSTSKGFAP